MRTVVVFLRDTTKEAVGDYLAQAYPYRPGPPWIMDVDGDPALYIDFCRGLEEPWLGDYREVIVQTLGGEPIVSIAADISGRHPEDEHSRAFVCGLLTTFDGMAMDEYTYHCWSLDQILTGYRVQGHTYNDYLGWHEEWRNKKT